MVALIAKSVAVTELPVQDPDEPDALPVKAPIKVVAVTIPAIDAAAPTILVTSMDGEPLRPVAVPVKGPENPVAVATPVIITPPYQSLIFLKMIHLVQRTMLR